MGFQDYMEGSEAPPSQLKRILPFIFIIFLIFGSAHFFAYEISARSISNFLVLDVYRVILTIGLFSMPIGFISSRADNIKMHILSWIGYIWMGLFTLLFFFCLIESVLLISIHHSYSYWTIILTFLIGIWSLWKGLRDPLLIEHKIANEKLAGLKLVQISDLHVGMLHLNEKWLARIVARIQKINPDIITITGDLVEGEFKKISPMLESLKSLPQKAHKFYITGNHEYIHGSGPWEQKLASLGFTVLHNENRVLSYAKSRILMAGVPDRMIKRFNKSGRSLPDTALTSNEPTDYKILLAHEPASAFDIKTEKSDLILTGHTHGGQIFPFHLLVRLAQPVVAGFKQVNGHLVFAHQGTGFWGPPMRWFSRSEIVLFTWH